MGPHVLMMGATCFDDGAKGFVGRARVLMVMPHVMVGPHVFIGRATCLVSRARSLMVGPHVLMMGNKF